MNAQLKQSNSKSNRKKMILKKHQINTCFHLRRSNVLLSRLKILLNVIWVSMGSRENLCDLDLTALESQHPYTGPCFSADPHVSFCSLSVSIQYHGKILGLICEVLVNYLSGRSRSSSLLFTLSEYSVCKVQC